MLHYFAERLPRTGHFKGWLQELLTVWRSLSRAEQVFCATALFAGIVLRAQNLARPMVYDETFTYAVFVKPGILHALFRYDYPNNHILHSLLVYFSTIFSSSEVFIRLPAFFFSLSSLVLLFLFARRFFGVTPALFALALSALSYYQINYAYNARGYSMNVFFSLLSAYGIFSVIRDPLGKTAGYWLMFVVGAVLNIYTVISSAIYLVSIGVFGLPYLFSLGPPARRVLARDCVKYTVILAGATLLLYIPPIIFGYFYPDRIWLRLGGGTVSAAQSLAFLQQTLVYLFAPFAEGGSWGPAAAARLMDQTIPMSDWTSARHGVIAFLAGAAAIGVFLTAREDRNKGLLLASIVATPFLLLLLSRHAMYERNLLYVQPFIFISIGVFFARIQAHLGNKLPSAAVTAAIMGLIGLAGYRTTYAEFTTGPNLSPIIAAAELNKALRPDDAYFPNYRVDNHLRYYLTGSGESIYMRMFEYKRNGTLNARIKDGLRNIYCVFDGEPDFDGIFRIYGIDQEILGRHYGPFTLYFQSDTVGIYMAERKSPPGKRSSAGFRPPAPRFLAGSDSHAEPLALQI